MTTVYVIMGNDFPDAVFSTRELADDFIRRKTAEENKACKAGSGLRRIYWRSYQFTLDQEPRS